MLKLQHRPEESLVPEGNKLYFLTLFIRNEKGEIFTAQKGLQATQPSGPPRGLCYTEAPPKIATDKLPNMTDFKACKIAPFLLPCCMVTPGITHYVMLINATDFERRPSAIYHQKMTALTQPRFKPSSKAI
jgi:hypothetical protein